MMIINLFFAFYMAVDEYGLFSFYDYIALFCFSVSNLGLSSVLTKELQTRNSELVARTFVALKYPALILLALVGHLYLFLLDGFSLLLVLNFTFTMLISSVWEWYFIGRGKTKKLSAYYLCSFVTTALLVYLWIAVYGGITAVGVRTIQIITTGICLFTFGSWIIRDVINGRYSPTFSKNCLSQGLNMLAVQITQNGALIILSHHVRTSYGLSAVGTFSLYMRIANVFLTLRNVLVSPLTILLVKAGPAFYLRLTRVTNLLLVPLSVLVIMALYFSQSIIHAFPGESEYISSSLSILLVPVVAILFCADGVVLNIWRKQSVYFRTVLISFIVFILTLAVSSGYKFAVLSYVAFEISYLLANHLYIRNNFNRFEWCRSES
ncbi:hypothetical protein [Ferrimonas pelagia]|uniref:hypothetical protein n=1 Tax=Ferrimonas pelagia TaxID=1177826 RepID=UPI0031E9738B